MSVEEEEPFDHFVFKTPLEGPFPGASEAMFGMGCFWAAEERFYKTPGVISTAAGFSGGKRANPSYFQVRI